MSRACLVLLLLGGLRLNYSCAGWHSHKVYFSSMLDQDQSVQQFLAVGYMDDLPIEAYNPSSRTYGPRTAWMGNNEDHSYWEDNTQYVRNWEKNLRADVKTVMGRLNHTRGVHTVQMMVGCEIREDGSTGGLWQYAYDGHDFISFDKDRLTWVAAISAAQLSQQNWNKDQSFIEQKKDYLEQVCIRLLQEYLQFGKEALHPVPPETMVSHHKSGASNARLTCHAYKFYPREIEVKWFRNGVEIPAKFLPHTLPNPDGTYQIKTTVDVPEGEEEMYTCRVDHSSLENVLNVKYEKKAVPIGLIIGAIAGVVILLAAAIGGIVIWRKRSAGQGGYAAANKGPIHVDSSSSTAPA